MKNAIKKIQYTLKYDSIRPAALWISAILFGFGLIIRLLPKWMNMEIYRGYMRWDGLGIETWGIISMIASMFLVCGLLWRKTKIAWLGAWIGFAVFTRASMTFIEVAAFTGTYVYALHALMCLWLIIRIQTDEHIV